MIGGVAGGVAGYISGGWKGAIAGGAVGALTGAFAPYALGALVESISVGGAAFGAGAAGSSAAGAAGGVAGNMLVNALSGKQLTKGNGLAAALGALPPLASGEAFLVGAGGGEALSLTAVGETVFGGLTALLGIVASLLDPNSEHGLFPQNSDLSFAVDP